MLMLTGVLRWKFSHTRRIKNNSKQRKNVRNSSRTRKLQKFSLLKINMHVKTDVCRANWMLKCIKHFGVWTHKKAAQHAFIRGSLSWIGNGHSQTTKCLCTREFFFKSLLTHGQVCSCCYWHFFTFAFYQELVSVATFICSSLSIRITNCANTQITIYKKLQNSSHIKERERDRKKGLFFLIVYRTARPKYKFIHNILSVNVSWLGIICQCCFQTWSYLFWCVSLPISKWNVIEIKHQMLNAPFKFLR